MCVCVWVCVWGGGGGGGRTVHVQYMFMNIHVHVCAVCHNVGMCLYVHVYVHVHGGGLRGEVCVCVCVCVCVHMRMCVCVCVVQLFLISHHGNQQVTLLLQEVLRDHVHVYTYIESPCSSLLPFLPPSLLVLTSGSAHIQVHTLANYSALQVESTISLCFGSLSRNADM